MKKIDCFIPYAGKEQAEKTVQGLQITGLVGNIHLVTTDSTLEPLPGDRKSTRLNSSHP